MARFACVCGYVMTNQEAPNDVELHVYSDREWDDIINLESIVPVDIPDPRFSVWKCPICHRIYVFDDEAGGELMKRYAIEWKK